MAFIHDNQGNKSFVAFSNLNDTESLTKTWKALFFPLSSFGISSKCCFRSVPRLLVTSNKAKDSRT